MKGKTFVQITLGCVLTLGPAVGSYSQEIGRGDCLYLSSLHSSAKGMAYWYDKAQGGLETVTGIPYVDLGCKNCHVKSCDACHKADVNGKPAYSVKEAESQDKCLTCHAREASIMKIDKGANTADVHFASGMSCMDCHSAREMHGDSLEYVSMKEKGAMDANCEGCHESLSKIEAHTVHGSTVDCKACHVRQVVSCTNCHFETMVQEGRRVAVPVSGWVFLMNRDGKVTSANMQTFVMKGNKTFMIFAPQFSHSVYKGAKCEDCHATDNVKQVQKGSIALTWVKDGKMENVKGIVPVVDGVRYNNTYENFSGGTWTPIVNTETSKVQYVGFGSPLTKEQMEKLEKPQKSTAAGK